MIAFESIFEGSTFPGAEIELSEEIDGALQPVNLSGAVIKMNMTRNETIYKTYKTEDNSLIVDGNKIKIPKHTPDLPAGVYSFDFSVKLGNDTQNGVAAGQWEILNPITK